MTKSVLTFKTKLRKETYFKDCQVYRRNMGAFLQKLLVCNRLVGFPF